jgi:hypothetical protein
VPHDPVIAAAFERQGHVMISNMLPKPDVARAVARMAALAEESKLFEDRTLGTSIPAAYGDPVLDEMMNALIPRMEYCTGLALYPTYSFCRLYKRGDQLKPHRDRRACEISVSINLGQMPDTPWALGLEGRDKIKVSALLKPGDALIYRGIELTHWRDPYDGDQAVQIFMHYVDRHGPNAGERFDLRPALGTPNLR